jgi:excisionase family DNA binding protein
MAVHLKHARALQPVLTFPEVSELLRIHRGTLYRLIKRDRIPFIKIGSDYRFPREAIDVWRRAQEQHPPR